MSLQTDIALIDRYQQYDGKPNSASASSSRKMRDFLRDSPDANSRGSTYELGLRESRHAPKIPGNDQPRRPQLQARLERVSRQQDARRRSQCASHPLRRHWPGGMVDLRRADRDADP